MRPIRVVKSQRGLTIVCILGECFDVLCPFYKNRQFNKSRNKSNVILFKRLLSSLSTRGVADKINKLTEKPISFIDGKDYVQRK